MRPIPTIDGARRIAAEYFEFAAAAMTSAAAVAGIAARHVGYRSESLKRKQLAKIKARPASVARSECDDVSIDWARTAKTAPSINSHARVAGE